MANQDTVSRRSFLNSVILSWSAVTVTPFLYGVIRYIFPPARNERIVGSLLAAKVPEIPNNTAKIVKFNKQPVIIIHTPNGQFKAFSARCTHLGCVVEYKGEERQLHCNCHGSVFDLNGKNLKGPASIPLAPLKVTLDQANIIVSEPTI